MQKARPQEPNIQTVLIRIKGMTCSKCSERIARILKQEQGVRDVSVSLERQRARVSFDANQITQDKILRSVTFTEFIPSKAKPLKEGHYHDHHQNESIVHNYEASIIAKEEDYSSLPF